MNNTNDDNLISGVTYMFSGKFGVYPGSTTRPSRRPKEHLSALANRRHWNLNFQQVVDEHGLNCVCYFEFGPYPINELPLQEQALIDNATKAGLLVFNKNRAPATPHPVGYKLSAKTRKRQSRAKKGNKNAAKHFSFVLPSGTVVQVDCLSAFCKKEGLGISAMSKVASGKQKSSKGWRAVKENHT